MSELGVEQGQAPAEEARVEVDVWVLGDILRRHRRLIGWVFAVLTGVGVLVALLRPRTYAADALLCVSSGSGGAMRAGDVELIADYVAATREQTAATHVHMLRSNANLSRSLASLRPEHRAAFPELPWLLPVTVKAEDQPLSNLVRITVVSRDPEAAIALANALADTHISSLDESNRELAHAVTRSLEPEREAANARLAAAQAALTEARKRLGVYAFGTEYAATLSRLTGIRNDISDVDRDISANEAALAKAEGLLAKLPAMSLESKTTARDASRDQLQQAVTSYRLGERTTALEYAEGSREVARARERLAAAEELEAGTPEQSLKEVQMAANPVVKQLEQQVAGYQVAITSQAERVRLLKEEEARQRERLAELNRIAAEMQRLEADVGTKQGIRDTLEQKAQQMIVNAAARLSTIQVVSRPAPPLRPAGFPKRLLVLVAATLGIVLGVTLAVILEAAELRRRGVSVEV